MTTGQKIRSRRIELGLSVDQLAERLGKNRATVYRYESDAIKDYPSSVLESIAKALMLTPGDLIGSVEEKRIVLQPEEEMLVRNYRKLNSTGKSKALEYVCDLADSSKYTKDTISLNA